MVRFSRDPETRAYRDRRKTDGPSHREIVRCLKRYLARRLYPILLKDLAALTLEYQCPAVREAPLPGLDDASATA